MKVGFLGTGQVARQLGALADAVGFGDLIVLGIPYAACAQTLPPLAVRLRGKVVVDATNPLNPDWSPLVLPRGRSGAEEIAALVPGASVVKAFNTVFADTMTPAGLDRGGAKVTTFIASDDQTACELVARFATSLGFHPRVAGPLKHAALPRRAGAPEHPHRNARRRGDRRGRCLFGAGRVTGPASWGTGTLDEGLGNGVGPR